MIFVSLVKAAPGKAKALVEGLRELPPLPSGVRLLNCYITYGCCDAVCVWEAPDLTTANRTMRSLMESGLGTTETMVGQTPEEFLK